MATLHSTDRFHREDIETLGWELTVSNALDPPESPCRRCLKGGGSYGARLLAWAGRWIPLERVDRVLEVGGGYGYLMRDLLAAHPFPRVTMLDISPFLLNRQKEPQGLPVRPLCGGGFSRLRRAAPARVRLDHPEREPRISRRSWGWQAMVRRTRTGARAEDDSLPARVRRLQAAYAWRLPGRTPFNFNLGAVEAWRDLPRGRSYVSRGTAAKRRAGALPPVIDVRAGGIGASPSRA